MKIMIDEKAAKLAEELSEVVAVEDGNVQVGKNLEVDGDLEINGETNTNNLYKFDKILNPEDFNQYGNTTITLPRNSLLIEIKIGNTIIKPLFATDPFEYCLFIQYNDNIVSVAAFGNIEIEAESAVGITLTISSIEMGGKDKENFIDITCDAPERLNDEIITLVYQTNNEINYNY